MNVTYLSDAGKLPAGTVSIYGSGGGGQYLLDEIRRDRSDIDVDCFIDSFKPGVAYGLPVEAFSEYRKTHDMADAAIVIATTYLEAVLVDLHQAEVGNVYVYDPSRAYSQFYRKEGELDIQYTQKLFDPVAGMPPVEVVTTNAYVVEGGYIWELVDFRNQVFLRWEAEAASCPVTYEDFVFEVPQDKLPSDLSHIGYLSAKMAPHVLQLSPTGRFLVGSQYNGFQMYIIDRETNRMRLFPDECGPDYHMYSSTGDFTPDGKGFYFVRWTYKDTKDGLNRKRDDVCCEIGVVDMESHEVSTISEIDYVDCTHQISLSGDGRYLVFTAMSSMVSSERRTDTTSQEEMIRDIIENIVPDRMLTFDLESGQYWFTEIPDPVPAHFEFDPIDPLVFYVSSHQLLHVKAGVLITGPASIFKMRIKDCETVIEGKYTNNTFLRGTQHKLFCRGGKTYIAVTNQNNIDIIDGDDMSLWRRTKIWKDERLDELEKVLASKDIVDPMFFPPRPDFCASISPSKDGKSLILRGQEDFYVYDIEQDAVIASMPMISDKVVTHACVENHFLDL